MTGSSPTRAWRAGVIAAGLGERLQDGRRRLKPLVPVAGRALVEHVLLSVAEAQPSEVVMIVNEASLAVKEHVASKTWPFAIRWIVETTPSSMHSFLRVVETLAESGDAGPFLMSTVDTIAPRGAFAEFAVAAGNADADVTLAIAPPPDDEKPLLVEVGRVSEPDGTVLPVTAIGHGAEGSPWATSGYYAVRASVLREADAARAAGLTALRAFLGRLLTNGYKVGAVPVAAGIDVDRPADIEAAEHFLRQAGA
ncbi:MAG TPA: NDP-sugar synthase [Vicinamibacterales bacterium]|jgi:NDP-sugar pyrophosphorylase family protein|nr:NDP-sugar synthase [Vicinamibacterales bacterium]